MGVDQAQPWQSIPMRAVSVGAAASASGHWTRKCTVMDYIRIEVAEHSAESIVKMSFGFA
jgi:hypothetical protein